MQLLEKDPFQLPDKVRKSSTGQGKKIKWKSFVGQDKTRESTCQLLSVGKTGLIWRKYNIIQFTVKIKQTGEKGNNNSNKTQPNKTHQKLNCLPSNCCFPQAQLHSFIHSSSFSSHSSTPSNTGRVENGVVVGSITAYLCCPFFLMLLPCSSTHPFTGCSPSE